MPSRRFVPLNAMNRPDLQAPDTGGFDPASLGSLFRPAASLANFGGFSDAGTALGGLGGLFSLGTGIASGNPMQATTGAITAGNAASGLLGGPTIGGGISSLAPSLSAFMPGLAGSAALAPFALMAMGGLNAAMSGGGDLFDTWFGEPNNQAARQIREHGQYLKEFPELVQRRTAGAGVFDQLGELDQPDEIYGGLRTAESGINATNLGPAYEHLAQKPYWGNSRSDFAADIPGMDLSWWEARAPELESKNWGAYMALQDKSPDAAGDMGFGYGNFGSGSDYRTQALALDQNLGLETGQPRPWSPELGNNFTTREAYDISNAIAGIGGGLGIDWGSRGADGRSQGYEVRPDQLADLGFAEGNYLPAIADYLRALQPGIEQHEKWSSYFG